MRVLVKYTNINVECVSGGGCMKVRPVWVQVMDCCDCGSTAQGGGDYEAQFNAAEYFELCSLTWSLVIQPARSEFPKRERGAVELN